MYEPLHADVLVNGIGSSPGPERDRLRLGALARSMARRRKSRRTAHRAGSGSMRVGSCFSRELSRYRARSR